MRGCKLNSLTPSNGGTTAPISYTQCYKYADLPKKIIIKTHEKTNFKEYSNQRDNL